MDIRLPIALALTASLSGCGTMPQDRAVSGAGLGAGVGAAVGAVTGLSVLGGAALGATGGALTGALTSDRQIDLGAPAWKQGRAKRDRAGGGYDPTVATIQARLNTLGYDAGPVDGIAGDHTQTAIRAYQRDQGLLVDGRATPQLAEHVRAAGS